MRNFFTSDTHFYHKNILKFEDRPYSSVQEMNESLIKNWNKKVTKHDNVYILGDFSFGDKDETVNLLNRLNGNKFLIKGNHDHVVKHSEVKEKFAWVKDYYMLKTNGLKVVLFHYPIQVWDCKYYNSIHLYGHIHSNKGNHHPLKTDMENSYNVGVDVNNFEPVSLEEVLKKLNYKI